MSEAGYVAVWGALAVPEAPPVLPPPLRPSFFSAVSQSAAMAFCAADSETRPSQTAAFSLSSTLSFGFGVGGDSGRSEEHTSELQSHLNLACRLLLEKTKTWFTPRGPSEAH